MAGSETEKRNHESYGDLGSDGSGSDSGCLGATFTVTLTGTGDDDSLKGSDKADTPYARGGSDSVFDYGRDDKLSGEGDADGL